MQAIDVAREQGLDEVVLTTGGRSERYAMAALPHLPEQAFVQMGDFVGAPLTHNYCTISLSDLLTPWPVIERRITAAAAPAG